jgi:hypothetical protein
MKKLYICVLIYLFTILTGFSSAQTTWVKTQNLDNLLPSQNHDSTHVGPNEMCLTPNGIAISIIQINQNGNKNIYAMDSLGRIMWTKHVSIPGGIYTENCEKLKPTPDNGCVYFYEHYGTMNQIIMYNLGAAGNLKWSKTFNNSPYPDYIIPTYQNTFYVKMHNDSLVELNGNGNFIRQRKPFTGQITALPDTDFIFCDPSRIARENFSGGQQWNLNAINFNVIYADSSFVYARSSLNIMKINSTNGNVIWSKLISSNMVSVFKDGSFIVNGAGGNQLTAYDSSGIQKWTKYFAFPHYGLTSILACPNKTYFAGGCWKNNFLFSGYTGFSPFIMNLDSSGNGVIDSTDYYYVGNANDNNKLSFADDGVYIAAALNSTGPPRDNLLKNYTHSIYNPDMNVFGTDWPDSFQCGMNYKYSDFDGSGMVDTVDIRHLSEELNPNNFQVTPHYLRLAETSIAPDINFVFDYGSFDTLKINLILGDAINPVDSIYGISLEYFLFQNSSTFKLMTSAGYTIHPTAFGIPNNNLFCFQKTKVLSSFNLIYINEIAICRTDHQNTNVAGDTVVTLYFVPDSSGLWPDTIFTYVNYNAISKSGCPISLNLNNDPIITSHINAINEIENSNLKISPSPCDKEIKFSIGNSLLKELKIFDSSGRLVSSIKNVDLMRTYNTSQLSEGLYFVIAETSNKIYKSKFNVIHK